MLTTHTHSSLFFLRLHEFVKDLFLGCHQLLVLFFVDVVLPQILVQLFVVVEAAEAVQVPWSARVAPEKVTEAGIGESYARGDWLDDIP